MLKSEMYARKTCQLCQRKSVAKRLFDSVLAKNQIFLNETDGRRLEKKTPREIINMGRKSVYARRVNTARKTICCKTTNQQSFVNKIT